MVGCARVCNDYDDGDGDCDGDPALVLFVSIECCGAQEFFAIFLAVLFFSFFLSIMSHRTNPKMPLPKKMKQDRDMVGNNI